MTRVSVAIAVHDDDAYLGAALDSVLPQLGPDDDVIVVDDGSTDGTPDLLDRYQRDEPRLRLLSPGRVGLSAARNLGVAATEGTYITFIDADDLWVPGTLDDRLDVIEASGADVVVGRSEEFLDDAVDDPARHGLRAPAGDVRGWFLGALLARREAFARVRFDEDQSMAITVDWLGRARRAGLTFELFERVALRRRIRPGSMTTESKDYHRALLGALRANIQAERSSP